MKKAFTLIELLVVMALIAFIAGSGAVISISAGRKKAVDRAAEDLASAMRQARDFAQAGKKNASCGQVPLDGWQVIVEATRYTVQGVCGSSFGVRQINFLGGATATTTGNVLFKPLSLGTDRSSSLVVNLRASGYTKIVTVTKNGEVSVQ